MKAGRASQAEDTAMIRQRRQLTAPRPVLWAISRARRQPKTRVRPIVAAATLEDLMTILVTTASRGRSVRTW
jgi:hypothetical protein